MKFLLITSQVKRDCEIQRSVYLIPYTLKKTKHYFFFTHPVLSYSGLPDEWQKTMLIFHLRGISLWNQLLSFASFLTFCPFSINCSLTQLFEEPEPPLCNIRSGGGRLGKSFRDLEKNYWVQFLSRPKNVTLLYTEFFKEKIQSSSVFKLQIF